MKFLNGLGSHNKFLLPYPSAMQLRLLLQELATDSREDSTGDLQSNLSPRLHMTGQYIKNKWDILWPFLQSARSYHSICSRYILNTLDILRTFLPTPGSCPSISQPLTPANGSCSSISKWWNPCHQWRRDVRRREVTFCQGCYHCQKQTDPF